MTQRRGHDHKRAWGEGKGKNGGVRLLSNRQGHRGELLSSLPQNYEWHMICTNISRTFSAPPPPGLTSPEAQEIPASILTRVTPKQGPHWRGLLQKGPSLPLCLTPKSALAGKGQNPEGLCPAKQFTNFSYSCKCFGRYFPLSTHKTHTRCRIIRSINKQKLGSHHLNNLCKCFCACPFDLFNSFHICPVPVICHSARHIVGTQELSAGQQKEERMRPM